jgi:hypothetical protein
MKKLKEFIKISGNLLENEEVIARLRKSSKKYFVAVCTGGGEQINKAFKKRGFRIRFGPLGRITSSAAEERLVEKTLKNNQATVHSLLSEKGIRVRVIIPLDDIAGVLCSVNGDIKLLSAYNGYDRLSLFTFKKNVAKKKLWLKKVAKVFRAIGKGELDKIKVVGF